MSNEVKELFSALAQAQGEFTAAERAHVAKVMSKKGEGSSYSYNYADLQAYLDVCREPLAKYGLGFLQSPKVSGATVSVITLLTHSSGQWWESDPLELTASEPTPQAIGSCLTYCRRYSLSAATGMASEADDDGANASGLQADTGRRAPKPTCPKCGKSEFVLADREVDGRFFCWKNADKGKLGCGHKWDAGVTDEQPPAEPPKTKAKAVAKEHGMKTADELPPLPTEKTPYQKALEEISKAIRNRDLDYLGKVAKAVTARTKEGVFNPTEDTGLMNAIAMAEKTIEAAAREPVAA